MELPLFLLALGPMGVGMMASASARGGAVVLASHMGVTMSRKTMIVAAVALAALALAGCGTSTVTPTAQKTTAPAQSSSGASASPSPTQHQQAHVGDQFTVTLENGTKYEVMLQRVDQQASPANEFEAAQPGHHLAAAQLRVSATTSVDENANNNATATGSDEQAYTSSIASVAEGTNFANGQIRLQPGSSLVGWVTFELPDGVRITKVQWTPASGFSAQAAEWLVTGSASASAGPPADPADTVRAYFAAINNRDYAQAWKLGGQHTGSSYSAFVGGLTTTANDTVTILSVAGNVVTARLTAQQTDGTVKTYQGTYTVSNGVIIGFNVRQVG
jgi:hypothetical protein